MVEVVEEFLGVYLLYCSNPKYKGRTYIGFTVDPNRRIKQHNKGKRAGGAWRTSNKGPWDMVLVIHGFPNEITALRFEWAWQHPQRSRRLQHVAKKRKLEKQYQFCFRVLSEMLRVGPWCRLPLTIRWLQPKFALDFAVDCQPPNHMPVAYGPVKSKKLNSKGLSQEETANKFTRCKLCCLMLSSKDLVECVGPKCDFQAHIVCLANTFLKTAQELIPIQGPCPSCKVDLLWGDIIRKKKGCYEDLESEVEASANAVKWTKGLVVHDVP